MAVSPDPAYELSGEDRDLIAVVAECFEAAARGELPTIETHLALARAPAVRQTLLLELIRIDTEARAARGLPLDAESYLSKFADELTGVESAIAAVIDGAAADSPPSSDRPAYQIVRELGRGAMGVVYLAVQTELGREVALKHLASGYAVSPALLARFRAEAQVLAAVRHTHVVSVYDAGETRDGPYIAMEYCPGGTLDEQFEASGTLPPTAVAMAIRGVAEGLHQAHELDILHRDVKPANILIDAVGVYKLADFGLAQRADRSTHASHLGGGVGTPAYMAPEQFDGDYSRASDVYGLGAVLYHWLTGWPPFTGSFQEVLHQVQTAAPPSVRRLNAAVPRDLEVICLKCLEKSPRDRYSSAKALAADLDRLLCGQPILAKPATPVRRAWKWARRNPASVAILGLVLSGLIVSSWLTANWVSERTAARERQVTARQYAYYNSVSLADRAWLIGNVEQSEAFLDECPEEFHRFWEWNHLKRRIHSELISLACPGDLAARVAWSSDGRLLAATEGDGDIRLWEPDGGHIVRTLSSHVNTCCISFDADARLLVSTAEDGTIKVWNTATGRLRWQALGHTGPIWAAVVSPDGRRLATAGEDRTVRLWEVESGTKISEPLQHSLPVRALAFHPNGMTLFAVGGNQTSGELRIWAGNDGAEQSVPKIYSRALRCVCVSSDGKRVAVGSAVRDPRIGERSVIRVYDETTARELRNFRAWTTGVCSISFGSDSRSLISSGGHAVQVWDTETGEETARLNIPRWNESMALSADRRRVATGCTTGPKLWDLTSTQGCRTFRGHRGVVNAVAFSPDGQSVATGGADETLVLRRVTDGHVYWEAPHPGEWKGIIAVAFSPDGRQIASASRDGAVRLWDAKTGAVARRLPQPDATCVAFSPDSRHLATAAFDGVVKIWNAHSGDEVLSIHFNDGPLWGLGFSPDGSHLTMAGRNGQIAVCDAETGRRVTTMTGHVSEVTALAYSPTRPVIATASGDRTVRLWDAQTGREISKLQGHNLKVTAIAFSPDGDRVASTSDDGTVRLWDSLTGREVLTISNLRGGTECVSFSPDGAWLATAGWDSIIRLWDGRPWDPERQ
jgi:WD40 repeat protein/serine/threonine protein kinase